MSLASKLTLGGACALTCGIIGYVHFAQEYERKRMHDGVVKDIERQQLAYIDLNSKTQALLDAKNESAQEKVLHELVGIKEPVR